MTCRDVQPLSSSYLDGELPEEICSRLQRHLLSCAVCRSELDTLRMAVEVWKAVEVPAVPTEEFVLTALNRLRRELNLTTRLPEAPGQLVLRIGETLR